MKKQALQIRVRFAPSPTGIPHMGNLRTALYAYLFAKGNKGEFLLRIEDTDKKRLVEGAEEAILESLSWLGIKWDEAPLHQSERLDLYKKYVQELLDKKIAHKKEGAVWVKLPENKIYQWVDQVGQKKISFNGKDVDEFVILKSDGFPTYHLANVIDDHLTQISHVIRGEEWISSTPKHLYLYESFGWEAPKFAHAPVILGPDKTKLSKRHGAKSALDYKKEGYIKEAVLNYFALLGWNPGRDKEIMSLDEMVSLFKLEDINTASPIFDLKKLDWLNGIWIRSLDNKDFEKRLREFYANDNSILEILESNQLTKDVLITAAKSRMRILSDFKDLILEKESTRKKTKEEKETAGKLIQVLKNQLGDIKWENENFLVALKKFSKSENIPFKTIYFLLSAKEHGIGLLELNQIYGKDFFIKNLNSE